MEIILGVKEDAAMRVVVEVGVDMKVFLTTSAIVGWVGLKPTNENNVGKIKGRKTLHGNKYLRVLLIEGAWADCRTKESRFFYKCSAYLILSNWFVINLVFSDIASVPQNTIIVIQVFDVIPIIKKNVCLAKYFKEESCFALVEMFYRY